MGTEDELSRRDAGNDINPLARGPVAALRSTDTPC